MIQIHFFRRVDHANLLGIKKKQCNTTKLPCIATKYHLCDLYNVGPMSSTLVQHCTNVIQMFCVYCAVSAEDLFLAFFFLSRQLPCCCLLSDVTSLEIHFGLTAVTKYISAHLNKTVKKLCRSKSFNPGTCHAVYISGFVCIPLLRLTLVGLHHTFVL